VKERRNELVYWRGKKRRKVQPQEPYTTLIEVKRQEEDIPFTGEYRKGRRRKGRQSALEGKKDERRMRLIEL